MRSIRNDRLNDTLLVPNIRSVEAEEAATARAGGEGPTPESDEFYA